jgi:hypothetical protein
MRDLSSWSGGQVIVMVVLVGDAGHFHFLVILSRDIGDKYNA